MGGTGCMCGGTHVKNTSEILGLTVTKIKKVMFIGKRLWSKALFIFIVLFLL